MAEQSDPSESFSLTTFDPEEPSRRSPRNTAGPAVFKDFIRERDQQELLATNVFDLLPRDHDCFLYADIFSQLDTSQAEAHYSPIGQRAYDPLHLISILIYAYTHGVFSSRQIARRCQQDLSFMYIAAQQCPSHRVLRAFRLQHGELFKACFEQTVKIGLELKLASLGHVSLDGSKFKANTSKHKAMSYKNLKKQEAALQREVAELMAQAARCDEQEDKRYLERTGYEVPEDLSFKQARLDKIQAAKTALEAREERLHPGEEIADKKQISFADHSANIMGKNGHYEYSYNAQISVDSENQWIVGHGLSERANDYGEVKPALAQIQSSAGRLPDVMSLDNGYYSGDNLEALTQKSIEAYVATNRDEKRREKTPLEEDRAVIKSDFVYDEAKDEYTCPMGKVLTRQGKAASARLHYQAMAEDCGDCPVKAKCLKKGSNSPRSIKPDDKEPLRREMNERMASEQGRAIYDKRKVIVEPVFGQIKNGGFRGFSVRGMSAAEGEFSLTCLAHNLKKMVKAASEGLIRVESGKWVDAAI